MKKLYDFLHKIFLSLAASSYFATIVIADIEDEDGNLPPAKDWKFKVLLLLAKIELFFTDIAIDLLTSVARLLFDERYFEEQ